MKNSFKNALYNTLGFLFPVTIALFTTPYIVHQLTPQIYGIYVLALSLMGLLSFLDLGFGQGIIKFVSQYEAQKDYEKINQIVGVSLIIYVVMGLAGGILIFSLSDFLARGVFKVPAPYVPTATLAFKLVACGFGVSFINGVFANIPKALQRYDVSVKIENIVWFGSVISAVVLLAGGKDLIAILMAQIFFLLLGTVLFYQAGKRVLPSLRVRVKWDRRIFREIFGFSFFTAANTVTGNIVVKADKMIIGGFWGTGAVAYYNIPFMIAEMGGRLIGAMTQHLFPGVSYVQSLGDKARLQAIFKRAFRYVVSISLIITVGLVLWGDNFLKLWMGEEFASQSAGLLSIISLVFFFSCVNSIFIWFYTGLGYTHINLLTSTVGSGFYLLGAFLLVPKLGLKGAAWSFALIHLPTPFYHFYLLKKVLEIDLKDYTGILLKASSLLGLAFLIKSSIAPGADSIVGLILAAVGTVLVLSPVLLFWGIFEKEELFFLAEKIKIIKAAGHE